jgi:hypothetical protein
MFQHKLLAGIRTLKTESLANLRDQTRITAIISEIGLAYDSRGPYGDSNRYMNNLGPGLWQVPEQLAQALCLLSELKLRSALEIGTFCGWTASVLTAYLSRFEPQFTMLTVDPLNLFDSYEEIRHLLPLSYRPGCTSNDLTGQSFDLCFIDGDHSYGSCSEDYRIIGQNSRVCMFHDINDWRVGPENVPRFWRELKAREESQESSFHEFNYHSESELVMGIGIRTRRM